jgi:hypothetical protein
MRVDTLIFILLEIFALCFAKNLAFHENSTVEAVSEEVPQRKMITTNLLIQQTCKEGFRLDYNGNCRRIL